MNYEPFVNLPTSTGLRYWNEKSSLEYIHSFRQAIKLEFFTSAFDFFREFDIRGDYFEFGCHQARTFSMALIESQRFKRDDMHFWAFDSFEGLPDSSKENPHFKQGAFATSQKSFLELIAPYVPSDSRVHLVPGFYSESLTEDIAAKLRCAALITIDCDLVSSFEECLPFAIRLLQKGTILYIDDWRNNSYGDSTKGIPAVAKKLLPENMQPFLSVGWWGQSFIAL